MIKLSAPMNLRLILIFAISVLAMAGKAEADPAAVPLPAPAVAQSDSCGGLHTDLLAALNRPTIGFSTCAVKPRDVVAEFGYTNERFGSGDADAVYPQSFVRYGVTPGWEVDVFAPLYADAMSAGAHRFGALDSGVGFKYQLPTAGKTQLAVDGLYAFANGARTFSAGRPTATINLDAGRSLTGTLSVGATLGYTSTGGQRIDGSNGPYRAWLPSGVVVKQLSPVTQLYAEAYGATRIRPDGGSRFALNGGVQTLVGPRFELDAEIGRTVTDLDRSHYLGLGFGVRL